MLKNMCFGSMGRDSQVVRWPNAVKREIMYSYIRLPCFIAASNIKWSTEDEMTKNWRGTLAALSAAKLFDRLLALLPILSNGFLQEHF